MTDGEILRALHDAANRYRARASTVQHPEARRLLLVASRHADQAAVALIRAQQAESDAVAAEPPTVEP